MNQIIDKCPICDNDLIVTALHCDNCRTNIQGVFEVSHSPLSKLTKEQMQFVLTFIKCEGKFNRMEEELDLSYPTLRSRFNEILKAMGYDAEPDEVKLSPDERKEILEQINEGKISINEAEILLRGKKLE